MFLTTINMGVHTLLIDDQELQLLESTPNYSKLTEAQATTYRLLADLSDLGKPHRVSESLLVTLLGLKDARPFRVRLRNLKKKGLIGSTAIAA